MVLLLLAVTCFGTATAVLAGSRVPFRDPLAHRCVWGSLGTLSIFTGISTMLVLMHAAPTSLACSGVWADELRDVAEREIVAPEALPEELGETTRASADVPSWVDTDPEQAGTVYRRPVKTDPRLTPQEAFGQLNERLREAVDEYINQYVGNEDAAARINYPLEDIKERLLKTPLPYLEERTSRYLEQPLYVAHALLEFDTPFRDEVSESWRGYKARSRLLQTALAVGGVLLLLATLLGYLKADTATRGFYSGRLQFLTAAAILALIALGVVLARWLPWL